MPQSSAVLARRLAVLILPPMAAIALAAAPAHAQAPAAPAGAAAPKAATGGPPAGPAKAGDTATPRGPSPAMRHGLESQSGVGPMYGLVGLIAGVAVTLVLLAAELRRRLSR